MLLPLFQGLPGTDDEKEIKTLGLGEITDLLSANGVLSEAVKLLTDEQDYDFDAHKQLVPMQPGDVPTTYADTSALERDFGFKPSTSLRDGLRAFAEWYSEFYK